MMMVALLDSAHFRLEAKNLAPVLAHLAVHGDVAGENLVDALAECRDHLGMVVEIGSLDELDVRMAAGDGIGCVIDALDENAGEQEVGEDDDAAETELRRLFEGGLDQRKSDAGIGRLGPAEA